MAKWPVLVLACLTFHATATAASDFQGTKHSFPAMHSTVEITVPDGNGSAIDPEQIVKTAEAIVRDAERLLSPKGEDSDVRRLNETPAGEWLDMDPLTMRAVREALHWRLLTDGLFDPTIAPLKRLFRFNGKSLDTWPSEADIASARERVGAEKLLVDTDGGRLAWQTDGMCLDLGGIAKGLAADLVAEAMIEAGVKNAIVNVGGEMRVLGGKPDDETKPWSIAITNPRDKVPQFFVEVNDRALATSGDYESYFEYNGKRFSHIIDPRTGSPVTERVAGATVSHPYSASGADALATVMCIMGSENAARFLTENAKENSIAGVEAVLFEVDDKERMSVTHISVGHDGTVRIETQ